MARAAVVVRAAAAPGDLDGIGKIDPSYSTDRIYRVRRSELGFWLDEERVSPPVHGPLEPSTRCSWLETQNVNYPAAQFYRRLGFRLCGLDETLYRPGIPGMLPGEVALYIQQLSYQPLCAH